MFAITSLLGNSFVKIDDTLRAKRIFSEAIVEAERLRDSVHAANVSDKEKNKAAKRVITAQIDLGNYYALREISEPAIELYKAAIPSAEVLNDTVHLYILNYNIAELNLADKDLEGAEYYVGRTNDYVTQLKPAAYHAGAKLLTGKLNYLQGDSQKAIRNLKESIDLSERSGFTDGLIEGYDYQALAEAKIGNYKNAFELSQIADSLKRENYKTDKIEAIQTVTAKFQLNQYQQELEAQAFQNELDERAAKRETTLLWVKIASGILLVFSIFLLISYRQRKKLVVDLIDKNKKYLEAKEASEESAKAKNVLFSNITHELRTPMYGIIGVSSILEKDKEMVKHQESLDSLKFSANYLLSLVNNVLQLTKLDANKKHELDEAPFNVRNLVDQVIQSSKYINQEHPNTYNVHIEETIPERLLGDELKLSQLLMNLVGNASKFTQNGVIELHITREEDRDDKVCLNFRLKDNGRGIPSEMQQHIFDEFANTDVGDNAQGTGLGLPIVKKILELYNTELRLKSEVNEGTEVSFSLCYKTTTDIEKTPTSGLNGHTVKFSGKQVLVVDDNKINRMVTRKILENYGAIATVSSNGPDAIESAKSNQYDLILMDINMPEMNGFEATEAIREFDKDVPIIALTAVEMEMVTEKNSFQLMNDFIIKPYDNKVFVETISKHTT